MIRMMPVEVCHKVGFHELHFLVVKPLWSPFPTLALVLAM